MDNPRPEKTAIVTEVRERLDAADGAILTEYRGLTVAQLADLRRALRAAGCDYKVYKNTLVRRAVAGNRHEELTQLLTGPTAIAFVSGELSAAAKALRDFSRANPSLAIKGGLHTDGFLSAQELGTLADLPSRDVLLARIAGAIAAPLQQMAGLLQALPGNLAYGLAALVDQQGGPPGGADTATETAETPVAAAVDAEAVEAEAVEAEAVEAEAGDAAAGDAAAGDAAAGD